jgi:hypothetical protein
LRGEEFTNLEQRNINNTIYTQNASKIYVHYKHILKCLHRTISDADMRVWVSCGWDTWVLEFGCGG